MGATRHPNITRPISAGTLAPWRPGVSIILPLAYPYHGKIIAAPVSVFGTRQRFWHGLLAKDKLMWVNSQSQPCVES